MRTVRYPLSDGNVGEPAAEAVINAITKEIEKRRDGVSPVHGSIKGYPYEVDEAAASTMKDVMAATAAFQGEIRAVRVLSRVARMARAKELVAQYWKPPFTPPIALALLLLMKDSAENADDWNWITDFIGKLPADVADQEEVRELNAFALANAGKPIDAIAKLEALIVQSGPTPERLGLLGGRYKRLYAKAAAPMEQMRYLAKSIEAYERGMELDLNQYYCSSNLPRLYKVRRRKGDDERALSVSKIVIASCERAKSLAWRMSGFVLLCWARPSTLATPTKPKSLLRTLSRKAPRNGNSTRPWPISKQAWRKSKTKIAGTVSPRS
jgi:hypothetical protein